MKEESRRCSSEKQVKDLFVEEEKGVGWMMIWTTKENTTRDGNRIEIGPDTVGPISYELGGRPGPQTMSVLQGLTTKLAEAVVESSMPQRPSES